MPQKKAAMAKRGLSSFNADSNLPGRFSDIADLARLHEPGSILPTPGIDEPQPHWLRLSGASLASPANSCRDRPHTCIARLATETDGRQSHSVCLSSGSG